MASKSLNQVFGVGFTRSVKLYILPLLCPFAVLDTAKGQGNGKA